MTITLNDITKNIKFNKSLSFPKINSNRFQQHFKIPENFQTTTDGETQVQEGKEISSFNFIPNEILEIPDYFSDFLNMNDYYIYGCNTLLETLIYLIDPDYKLENSSEKKKKLEEFYLHILDKLNNIFHNHKSFYNDNKIKRTHSETIIKKLYSNKNELEMSDKVIVFYIVCNIYEVNINIIDIDKKLYTKVSNNYDKNIILINYETKMLPLNQIYGKNLNTEEIDNMLSHFKQKINLKKITNYSLTELQELSKTHKIDIMNDTKKKTKLQLYNYLLLLT